MLIEFANLFISTFKFIAYFQHKHKKLKDSEETQAELVALCTYVENQAILEPIFLYQASKCKQTKEQGSEDCS